MTTTAPAPVSAGTKAPLGRSEPVSNPYKLPLDQRLRNYAACYPDHPALAAVLTEAAQALAVMSPRIEQDQGRDTQGVEG